MAVWEGFTQCVVPGPTCEVNWEAWATLATLLAVVAAFLMPLIADRRREAARSVEKALSHERTREQLWLSCARADKFFEDLIDHPVRNRWSGAEPTDISRRDLASLAPAIREVAAEFEALAQIASPHAGEMAMTLASIARGVAQDFDRIDPDGALRLTWREFQDRSSDQIIRAMCYCNDIRMLCAPPPAEWSRLQEWAQGRAAYRAEQEANARQKEGS